jgi:hypothetical protein
MFYFRWCKFLLSHKFIADDSSRPEPCTVSTIVEDFSKKKVRYFHEKTQKLNFEIILDGLKLTTRMKYMYICIQYSLF